MPRRKRNAYKTLPVVAFLLRLAFSAKIVKEAFYKLKTTAILKIKIIIIGLLIAAFLADFRSFIKEEEVKEATIMSNYFSSDSIHDYSVSFEKLNNEQPSLLLHDTHYGINEDGVYESGLRPSDYFSDCILFYSTNSDSITVDFGKSKHFKNKFTLNWIGANNFNFDYQMGESNEIIIDTSQASQNTEILNMTIDTTNNSYALVKIKLKHHYIYKNPYNKNLYNYFVMLDRCIQCKKLRFPNS